VIYPKDNRAKVAALADLGRSGIKIDIADPAVPVGKYTAQMLDQMSRDGAYGSDFKAKVLANVVSREDNVKSVVTKIRLGEADAGVVYVTDVSGEALKDVSTLAIPDPFNQTAEYPIGVAAKSQQAVAAAQFVTYVLSAEGQTVLKGYGFIPAGTAATTMPSP
jgi:molybdate transport system substrate-binding protein